MSEEQVVKVKVRRVKEILPGQLYVSSVPSKWKDREAKVLWLQQNVKHVVVLCNRSDEDLDAGIPGVGYLHYVVHDGHKALDQRLIDYVVPQVVAWVNAGEPTLVCCLAGRSRSGATVTLVVREVLNLSGAEALTYVRERRPNAVKRQGPMDQIVALPKPRP